MVTPPEPKPAVVHVQHLELHVVVFLLAEVMRWVIKVVFMHVKCMSEVFALCDEFDGEVRFASAITPFMLCAPFCFVMLGVLNIRWLYFNVLRGMSDIDIEPGDF
jgi:hypothetical protein